MILNATGVQALHVPYKGASESANAVLGKQVDFALTIGSVSMPHIQAGKIRALAVTGPRRNPRLPHVPTLAEAGIPGVSLVSFGGLSVPSGTPAPVVRARLEANGSQVAPSTPEEYADILKAEVALTEKMMWVAKLEPQ